MSSCYFKKASTDPETGTQIKQQSLVLHNTTFGLKSRFQALLALIEGQLAGKVKHFVLSGSSITSNKL